MATKGFTLRVTCHGGIAYVPSNDSTRMAALLCRIDPAVVPDSAVFVRFPAAAYSSESIARTIENPPVGASARAQSLRHIVLNGERLSIVANASAADQTLRMDLTKDKISSTPTHKDSHSLHWMPHIERLAPGHGDVKPGYLTKPPTEAAPVLVARVDFTQGRLGTTGVEKVQVPFKSSKSKVKKEPMAREALLEMDIDDDHFILRSESLDGTHHPENDMRFDAEEGSVLEIVIGNEPVADIYQETPRIDPVDVVAKKAADEFLLYYQLAVTPPVDPPLPHVAARPGLHTFCSGGYYNGSDDVTG